MFDIIHHKIKHISQKILCYKTCYMSNLKLPSINQRIKELINNQTDGNVTAFSQALGYTSAQKVNRLFKIDSRIEKYPVPSSTIISDISNKFDVNTDWIVSGTGEKYRTPKQSEALPLPNKGVMMVPLVNQYAHAGYMSGYAEAEYIDALPKIPWIVDHEYKGKYVSFEVRGDSMDDGLKHSYEQGDVLLCREVYQEYWKSRLHINSWDAFVIVHKTDGIVVKQIIKHDVDNGIITVHSFNPIYDDYQIDLREIAQIFNVVKQQKNK